MGSQRVRHDWGLTHSSDGAVGGSKYLLKDNHSQLMILLYFTEQSKENCLVFPPVSGQPSSSLCLTHALGLLSCDKGSAVSKPSLSKMPWVLSILAMVGGFLPSIFHFLLDHPQQQTCWLAPTLKHCPALISFIPLLSPAQLADLYSKTPQKSCPNYSSHCLTFWFQQDFIFHVKITVVKVINNHHLLKSNGHLQPSPCWTSWWDLVHCLLPPWSLSFGFHEAPFSSSCFTNSSSHGVSYLLFTILLFLWCLNVGSFWTELLISFCVYSCSLGSLHFTLSCGFKRHV